jgi:hypothetical protein
MPMDEGKVQLQCQEQVRSGSFWAAEMRGMEEMLGANGRVWYLHKQLPLGATRWRLAAARQQLWSE